MSEFLVPVFQSLDGANNCFAAHAAHYHDFKLDLSEPFMEGCPHFHLFLLGGSYPNRPVI